MPKKGTTAEKGVASKEANNPDTAGAINSLAGAIRKLGNQIEQNQIELLDVIKTKDNYVPSQGPNVSGDLVKPTVDDKAVVTIQIAKSGQFTEAETKGAIDAVDALFDVKNK